MDIYDFCEENPSNYEKTIISLAISCGFMEMYNLNDSEVMGLSNLLKIEYIKLKKALAISDTVDNQKTAIIIGDDIYKGDFYSDYVFLDIIIRYSFIINALSQISYQIDEEHLKNNYHLFKSMSLNFDMINIQSATYECIYNNKFSHESAVYSNSDFSPNSFCDILHLFLIDSDYYENNKNILPIIYQILSYEFYTRTNTLYLICVTQIIKHSPYFDESTCRIADDFYYHLLFMLRNARVISIQVNSLYQDLSKDSTQRTKRADNTTRLQVLYGFDNYDAYAVRLDLSHEGQGFIHYNNKSPGGIRCCLFNDYEYKEVIREFPSLAKCFIKYENRWALKELCNCKINSEERAQYSIVQKGKEHDPVFVELYSEGNVVKFIDILGNMLPHYGTYRE